MKSAIAVLLVLGALARATDGPFATPFVTHPQALASIMEAMYGGCLIGKWKLKGIDGCTHTWFYPPLPPVTIPTPCFRYNNTKPEKVVNASFNRFHIGADYPAPGTALQMGWVKSNDPQALEPVVSQGGFRIGDFGFSGSITAYGYVAAPSIEISTQVSLINALAAIGQICNPLSDYTNQIAYGSVVWNSSNDSINWNSNWKGWTSWYFYNFQTAYLASTAALMERTGLCAAEDAFALFCDGSFGTMYPATGVRNGSSALLGVFSAGKNSTNPTMAPFGFYGPLQNHLGAWPIISCHDPRSYGPIPFAPFMFYTRGHRNLTVQNLYKVYGIGTNVSAARPDSFCIDDFGLGNSGGQLASANAMYMGESLQKLDPKDPTITYLEYPFYTCCHWCTGVRPVAPMGDDIYAGSSGVVDATPAIRFPIVGRGMLTQSIYTSMQ